jgi:hypothetical protein
MVDAAARTREDTSYPGIGMVWLKQFEELEGYKKKHGDCNVPHSYKENPSLGAWVNNQRANWKNGKLDPKQKKLLADRGFVFDPVAGAWQKQVEELKKYKKRHGDCNVPKKYKENPFLATWVGTQRTAWKNGQLDPKRKKILADHGFDFDQKGGAWQKQVPQLDASIAKQVSDALKASYDFIKEAERGKPPDEIDSLTQVWKGMVSASLRNLKLPDYVAFCEEQGLPREWLGKDGSVEHMKPENVLQLATEIEALGFSCSPVQVAKKTTPKKANPKQTTSKKANPEKTTSKKTTSKKSTSVKKSIRKRTTGKEVSS